MDHLIQLSDGSSSVIALVLITSISATTFLLLPQRDRGTQLLWIVPCVALALFEAMTDNVSLSASAEAAAVFLGTLVLSVTLSEHGQSRLGPRVSPPLSYLICGLLALVAPIALIFGGSGSAATALGIGGILIACCWPALAREAAAHRSMDHDPEFLTALILTYGLLVLLPGSEEASPESKLYLLEAALPFFGVVIGFVSSAFAVRRAFRETERLIASEHAARMAREETAQFLRRLVDTTPAAVFVKDLGGRYRLINTLAAQWCGRSESEVLGHTDFDIFPESLAQSMREYDDLVITTGRQHDKEFALHRVGDGPARSIISHKFPLFGADGKVNLIAGLAIDMTAAKEHERELEAARFKAEEASCAKSNFLAHMSHELRTPLNAIIGFSEIIHCGALGPIGNELYRQYAGDIHTAGQLLLAHVDDLLDMSQYDSDNLELSLEPLNLALMAADCCHLLRGQADRRRITLEIERSRGLPHVHGDLRATMHVLVNLIGNAIKYLPPGSKIVIAGGRTESGVPYLLVEDDGPEQSAKDLQALADPWTFRPATKADDGRGGLGLLLARKLMEAQGGRLVVDSSFGSGTRIACQFANPPKDMPAGRALGG